MQAQLASIRAAEAGHAVKMARIRACNMATMFFIMPVSSFIVFAVVRCPKAIMTLAVCRYGKSWVTNCYYP